MEVVDDPRYPGKWIVLLNGTRRNCFQASECPGAALCAYNQSWMGEPNHGMCICNTKFGLAGINCDEWCAHGWAIFFINLSASCLALGLLIWSIYLLFRLSRRKSSRRCYCNPVAITLMFTLLGSLCFIIAPIVANVLYLGFPSLYILRKVGEEDRVAKRPPQALEYANNIMFGLAYAISICSFVILPLIWIDVARNSLRLRSVQTHLVVGLAVIIMVVILAIELPFFIVAASANRYRTSSPLYIIGIPIGWAIIFGFIILLNLIAFREIQTMKRTPIFIQGGGMNSEFARQLVRRINLTAVQIIIASIASVVFWSFLRERALRTFLSDPRCYADPIEISYKFTIFCNLYGCGVALWFITPSALGTWREIATPKRPIARLGPMKDGDPQKTIPPNKIPLNNQQRLANEVLPCQENPHATQCRESSFHPIPLPKAKGSNSSNVERKRSSKPPSEVFPT